MVSNLSPKQAAELIGISASTLAKLRLSGDGPSFLKLGKRVAYRPQDLEDWINQRVFRSTSEYAS